MAGPTLAQEKVMKNLILILSLVTIPSAHAVDRVLVARQALYSAIETRNSAMDTLQNRMNTLHELQQIGPKVPYVNSNSTATNVVSINAAESAAASAKATAVHSADLAELSRDISYRTNSFQNLNTTVSNRAGHYYNALEKLASQGEAAVARVLAEAPELARPQMQQDLAFVRATRSMNPAQYEIANQVYSGRYLGEKLTSAQADEILYRVDKGGEFSQSRSVQLKTYEPSSPILVRQNQTVTMKFPSGEIVIGEVLAVSADKLLIRDEVPVQLRTVMPASYRIIDANQAAQVTVSNNVHSGIPSTTTAVRYTPEQIAQVVPTGAKLSTNPRAAIAKGEVIVNMPVGGGDPRMLQPALTGTGGIR